MNLNDMGIITGVSRNTLAQWAHRGLIDSDVDEEMATLIMWLGELTQRGIPVGQALELYADAVRGEGTILLLTTGGSEWLSKAAYKKTLLSQFSEDPCLFAISFPHFFARAQATLANFQRVAKFRNKVGHDDRSLALVN